MDGSGNFSRRDLLRGASAAAGAAALGLRSGEAKAEVEERWSEKELKVEQSLYEGFAARFNKKFESCLMNMGSIKLHIRNSRALKRAPILVDVMDDLDRLIGNLTIKAEWRADLLNLGGLSPSARVAAGEILAQLIDMLDADFRINGLKARELAKKSD